MSPRRSPSSESVGPREAIGTIQFREDGVERTWSLGAHATRDSEATLRAHLARWRPRAEFLGATITSVPRRRAT